MSEDLSEPEPPFDLDDDEDDLGLDLDDDVWGDEDDGEQ